MRAQMVELMTRIRNLKDLLSHSIRIDEKDISRRIRDEIGNQERELRIVKVQIERMETQKKTPLEGDST